ncbi:hypothetical protein Fot_12852 [Forsythia ovata]|uniref:Uncharacterized protein n=1 Tax=Forsythia ovata TaxID=205694 RepID=A0ABD1W1V4_9LAMI
MGPIPAERTPSTPPERAPVVPYLSFIATISAARRDCSPWLLATTPRGSRLRDCSGHNRVSCATLLSTATAPGGLVVSLGSCSSPHFPAERTSSTPSERAPVVPYLSFIATISAARRDCSPRLATARLLRSQPRLLRDSSLCRDCSRWSCRLSRLLF